MAKINCQINGLLSGISGCPVKRGGQWMAQPFLLHEANHFWCGSGDRMNHTHFVTHERVCMRQIYSNVLLDGTRMSARCERTFILDR